MKQRLILLLSLLTLSTWTFAAEETKEEKDFKTNLSRIERYINEVKQSSPLVSKLESIKSLGLSEKSLEELNSLSCEVKRIISAQNVVKWIDLKAIDEAVADMKKGGKVDGSMLDSKVAELKTLVAQGFDGIYSSSPDAAFEAAEKALSLKRDILLSSPAIDADNFISVKYDLDPLTSRDVNVSALGTQPNNWSNISSAWRNNRFAEIVEFSGLRSGDFEYKGVAKPTTEGALITDLAMHWDGDRAIFTSLDKDRHFQIYEVNFKDGSTSQVTNIDEPDIEFFDAAYLPDGRIITVSNVGFQGVPCVNGGDQVGNIVLYDPSKNDFRRLTYDQDANWHPIVMANGKVMYVRWEYTDLTHYFSRIVMHMNPDGTEQKSLYGSGSMFPNSIFDVQPLPEKTNRFVGIISGHHGTVRSGRMMTFDPAKSRKEEKGMLQEYPYRDRPIEPVVKDQLVDGDWPQIVKPYPIDDNSFIVTAKVSPSSLWGLYLIDSYNNLTLIKECEDAGFIYGIPVKKRPTPPVIPDKVKLDDPEASVYIQDIYEGEGLRGVRRGEVKALRVFAYEYAYVNALSDHVAQGIQSGWDIKRLIGTVPVEEDGSVTFKIPANTPISLQPLDSEGRAIQWMRSWLTGMPGEVVSCVGCHEDQNMIPVPKSNIASKKSPHAIEITEGGVHSISFITEIEPMLKRTCIACHDESRPDLPNFKDTTQLSVTDWAGTRFFPKNYLAFHPYVNRQGPEADMYVMSPYEYHASTSEVVRILKRGHYGVELTDKEWEDLYVWIDLNAPYRGTFVPNKQMGEAQFDRRTEVTNRYGNGTGVDWRKEIRNYVSYLDSKGEIVTESPNVPAKPKYKDQTTKGWPLTAEQIKEKLANENGSTKEIEVAPGMKITFVRIPAGKFVMGTNNGKLNEAPEFKTEVKKGFWMSTTEITNEQYNALVPEHDSRIYAQFWKDHVGPGYPANETKQPVVRVSYEEAMAYAKEISKKTGLNVTLPTETQWEWAARGGQESDFWYGTKNSDFGAFANLADVQLEKMAVTGVDPQPMKKSDPWFKFYNFIPKEASVDDGSMIPTTVASYKPNQFGLYDIIGNLMEWTRSPYAEYPLSSKESEIEAEFYVARGGSYIDRPKDATVTSRREFLPWQRVNNVGFRLIIED